MSARSVVFALLREGTSDDALVPHLQELLIRSGISEAVGDARDHKGSTFEKLEKVCNEESPVDLIFVHRDADCPSDADRRIEIADAVTLLPRLTIPVVPVVPIQELEAWLLTDEEAIRSVAGKRRGSRPLCLPKPSAIEGTASPKQVLEQALVTASETSGRRLADLRKRFPQHRRTLLERMDIDGKVRDLPSWQALERDVKVAVDVLLRSTI